METEERKEYGDSGQRPSGTASLAAVQDKNIETGGPAQLLVQRSRFQKLPEDLEEVLGDRVFEEEDDFKAVIRELKVADERLVLGGDGRVYYYMPGEEHNSAVKHIVREFHDWAYFVKGTAVAGNTNVKLGPRLSAAPPRKRHKPKTRLPDIALWGQSKCEFKRNGKVSGELRVSRASPQPRVHPHIVIQVNIFNDEDYEVDAINDLATRAVAGQGAPPNLGVVIKLREAAPGVQAGFDIYYLPAGTFLGDALNETNGARHVVYNHGGPDVLVTITREDLGGINLSFWQSIREYWSGGRRDFELSMAELYREMF